jgi:hypothetical protein
VRREFKVFENGTSIGVLHDRVPRNSFAGFGTSDSGQIALIEIAVIILCHKTVLFS